MSNHDGVEVLTSRPESFDREYVPGYSCEICEDNGIKTNFAELRDLLTHDLLYHPDEEPG